MSDSSPWFISCTKLRFFARIRRFLKIKKRFIPSDQQFHKPIGTNCDQEEDIDHISTTETEQSMVAGDDDDDMLVVLQRSVKRLHFGSWEEKEKAAEEILRLAKDGSKIRKTLAELGVVPPLVEMVGSSEVTGRRRRWLAVQALIELANGTFTNKILMVEANILSKLPERVDDLGESAKRDMAQLLLSISSLTNNQYPLNSMKILPFLSAILASNSSLDTKELCLATLYNLSTMLDQAGGLATNEVVHTLLSLSSVKQTSEKALATLANLVVTILGKKAMDNNPTVPESLIEILTWEEKPKCQELSAYILMILAHQSSAQRQKMAKLGIVSVLLEVALLGSPLAQKRALKLLQWFKDERHAKIGPHSGPQTRRVVVGSPVNERDIELGRKMMKSLVKQSLYKNMETITRRACASKSEDCSSKLKALGSTSSSKSLPY